MGKTTYCDPLWPNLQPFRIMYKVGVEKILPEHSHVPCHLQHLVKMCVHIEQERRTTAMHLLKCLLDIMSK